MWSDILTVSCNKPTKGTTDYDWGGHKEKLVFKLLAACKCNEI
jgi:hypothetical protein